MCYPASGVARHGTQAHAHAPAHGELCGGRVSDCLMGRADLFLLSLPVCTLPRATAQLCFRAHPPPGAAGTFVCTLAGRRGLGARSAPHQSRGEHRRSGPFGMCSPMHARRPSQSRTGSRVSLCAPAIDGGAPGGRENVQQHSRIPSGLLPRSTNLLAARIETAPASCDDPPVVDPRRARAHATRPLRRRRRAREAGTTRAEERGARISTSTFYSALQNPAASFDARAASGYAAYVVMACTYEVLHHVRSGFVPFSCAKRRNKTAPRGRRSREAAPRWSAGSPYVRHADTRFGTSCAVSGPPNSEGRIRPCFPPPVLLVPLRGEARARKPGGCAENT